MKRFDDLTPEQKDKAIQSMMSMHLKWVVTGMIRFRDDLNGNDLQARVDRAIQRAEELQTPWFAGEYVMDVAGDEIRRRGEASAKEAFYPEFDEVVAEGVW
jgi:hypothetical protein